MNKLVASVLFAVLIVFAPAALAQDRATGSAEMQQLRAALKTDKKAYVAAALALTDAEAKKFWPVYEAYQKELHILNDQIAMLLVGYAKELNAGTLNDARASGLLDQALAIEDAELKSKRALVKKVRAVLPGIKATRYVQIENKVRALVKYEIAGEVPLAP